MQEGAVATVGYSQHLEKRGEIRVSSWIVDDETGIDPDGAAIDGRKHRIGMASDPIGTPVTSWR